MKKKNDLVSIIYSNPIKTIIVAGLIIRLLIIALYQHIAIYPDSGGYIDLAHRILSCDLNGYQGERSPGYPLLLCLANGSLMISVIIQMIIGIVTLIFTYKTLLIVNVRKRISLIVTLLIACYAPNIFFEFAILTESLTQLVLTFTFYTFFGITMQKRTGILSYLLLSFLCGYLTLIKPFYILLAGILFVFLILHSHKIKDIVYKYLVVLIFPLCIGFGWSYVNLLNTGYFVPTTYYGYNITQNCVRFAEKTTDEYKDIGEIYAKYREKNKAEGVSISMSIWAAYDELEAETKLSFVDLSKRLYDYSTATIAKNPGEYLQQVFISWCDFWKTSMYWEYDSFKVTSVKEAMLYFNTAERILFQLIKIIFVLLIPYNLIHYLRRRKYPPQFVISVVVLAASLAQAFATYGTNSRFSFPFELLIVTSVVLNYLSYMRYRRRQKQKS